LAEDGLRGSRPGGVDPVPPRLQPGDRRPHHRRPQHRLDVAGRSAGRCSRRWLPNSRNSPRPVHSQETLRSYAFSGPVRQPDLTDMSVGNRNQLCCPGRRSGRRPVVSGLAVAVVAGPTLAGPAPADLVPSDPRYTNQAAYLQEMHLPDAWNTTTGNDSMILAVVDSGVQLNHPDLAGRLVSGYDFVNKDPNPDDDFGHGTMVAGIAA